MAKDRTLDLIDESGWLRGETLQDRLKREHLEMLKGRLRKQKKDKGKKKGSGVVSNAKWLLFANSAHTKSIALMKFLSKLARKLGVGRHVYVVGGAVRNFVIDKPIKDIDAVIDSVALKGKDSEWFADKLTRAVPARMFRDTNDYGVVLLRVLDDWIVDGVNLKGEEIEIANARTESYTSGGYKPDVVEKATIQEDMSRREFTFNTLMWRLQDLASGPDKAEIIDLTGCGLRDLERGEMRCPSNPDKTFDDDASRMVRAIKFLVKYGFKIHPEVEAAIRRNKGKLWKVKPSQLAKLLVKDVLVEPSGRKALMEMDRLGLLDVIKAIAQKNKMFRNTLANHAEVSGVQFMFDLMDFNMPSGKRLKFLSSAEQDRLREVTVNMSRDDGIHLLNVLKQPGKAMDTEALIREFGIQGKEIGRLTKVTVPAILKNPTLAFQGKALTDLVRQHLLRNR
jgi:hypothetical protein